MGHILIVDDDVHIGNLLEEVLLGEGHQVSRAYSGTEVLWMLKEQTMDLVLLDLMLPGLSGEEVLERLKGIPIIIISAKTTIDHKVKLLMDGACDYITKPFDIREVAARVEVQLRTSSKSGARADNSENAKAEYILQWEDLTLNLHTYQAGVGKETVKLTKTEFAILKMLMLHPRQVITKSQLLDHISQDTPDCMESSLKVHISNLRKKLRLISEREYIEAVWGIGFKMNDAAKEPESGPL
ncbi:MAG: response regulator transcription factor [Firmicutes bacterium]|nr:response regulator transcription factor [Bacillota bacterium]